MIRFVFSLSFIFFASTAFSQTPIDGAWTLKSRRCEMSNNFEKITYENSTVFDSQKNTYTFTMKVGKDCVLEKVGAFYLEEINGSYWARVCLPEARSTGDCDQRILDHVNQVNQATPRCKHPVPYDLSEENQKLRFFELISLPDMFCGLGEKLYYDYERQ